MRLRVMRVCVCGCVDVRHCGGNSNMESGKDRAAANLAELAVLKQRAERAQGQGQQACPSLSPSRRPVAVVAASLLLLAKPSHIYFLRYCEKKNESDEKHMVCVWWWWPFTNATYPFTNATYPYLDMNRYLYVDI